jgi:hypothetical protein
LTCAEEACSVAHIEWWNGTVAWIRRVVGMSNGDGETELPPDLQGGDPETGRALQKFFLSLLEGTNLREYHQGRGGYLDKQTYLNDEARRLLMEVEGPLKEIEKHIFAVTGSGMAKPLWLVSPPY